MMRWFILFGAFVLSTGPASTQTSPPLRATLRVTVVDVIGNPVAHSNVSADPIDLRGAAMGMAIPQCITDTVGRCTLSNLQLFTYSVTASKLEDGYPEAMYGFFNAPENPRRIITFSPDHTETDIVVPIGKKGAILKGTVTDAETGKGLDANVEFNWVSDPGKFLSGNFVTNAQFHVVVPSDVAFTMVVSQDGYEPWTYTSASNPTRHSIQLRPGEELTLDIRLQPKHHK